MGVAAGATLASLTALALPVRPAAAAQDDPTTLGVVAGLNETFAFLDSVGAVGAFAEQVPGLSLTPGGPAGLGVTDLLTTGRDALLGGADFGGVNSVDALVEAIDGVDDEPLGDGRRLDLTAERTTTGDTHTLSIGFSATRRLDTGIDVTSASPKLTFTATDGLRADLALSGSFVAVYDESEASFRIRKDAATPSLSASVATSVPDPAAVSAGLGILGVGLQPGSTFDLDATLAAAFDDPDSDGALSLAEIGAPSAGAGLAGVTLTSGTLQSVLELAALPSPGLDLGSARASVTVSSPDLRTTDPVVSDPTGSLSAVNAFLNLSPRDLAQGLAEIATTLGSLQGATSVDLPYLRGSLDDAITSTEAIVEFLQKHVKPSTDPMRPGLPDFASLQDLLRLLDEEDSLPSGADLVVKTGSYDGSKVRFDLGISRKGGAPEPLNALGAATSGDGDGVTFTGTTLKDPSQDFSDRDGEAASYVGRQVLVGASSAIIASASGSTLTLDPSVLGTPPPAVAWRGGTPADGTAYSISAGDPRTGLVELGNVLKGAGAIANANATTPVATITPSYDVTLPIVLDLRPGSTSDCDPGPAQAPCPFQLKDPSTGLATVITELPLPADRIMLSTGRSLLTADAPITSAVDVNATVGFVGVKVSGTLSVCTQGAPADCSGPAPDGSHLFTLGLKPLGDAQGDATLPQIGQALVEALDGDGVADGLSTVVTTSTKGQAHAALTVDVPGAGGFFGPQAATATVRLPDITAPGGAVVTAPQLGRLAPLDVDPSNPLALFGVLLADLQAVQDVVGDLPGGGAALDTEIPVVGRSLSDLIGSGTSGSGATVTYAQGSLKDTGRAFDGSYVGRRVTVGTSSTVVLGAQGDTLRVAPWNAVPTSGAAYEVDSEIQGVVNLLTAAPPASLQEALEVLKKGLGIDTGPGEALGFRVDSSGPTPVLELDVSWVRAVEKTLPVNLDVDLGGTQKSLVGADANGVVEAAVGGAVDLGLRLPLSPAALAAPVSSLRIDPASSIKATASLTGTGLRLATSVGPFQLSLGNPDPDEPAGTELEASFGVALADTTHGTTPVSLADFAGALSLTMDNGTVTCPGAPSTAPLSACGVLPVYLNGAPVSPTDNAFVLRLPKAASSLADAVDLSGDDIEPGTPRFAFPADLAAKLQTAGLNLLTVGDGLFAYVEFLEDALQAASFGGKLPLVGQDLQAGSAFLAELRSGLEAGFAGAPTNPTAGEIKQFLNTNVAPRLPGAPASLPIVFECDVTLETPTAPDAVATNDGDTSTAYEYKVVASVNDPSEDGIPSEASGPVQNAAALGAGKTNTVTWTKVDFATGYKVLRRAGDETAFTLVGTVGQSDAPSFVDDRASGTAYDAKGTNPKVDPCPDAAPAGSVTGFRVSVDLQQGDPSAAAGCTTGCLDAGVPLDLGIPGLSFKASDAADDKVEGRLGWKLHLDFGLNRDDGFFVRTQDKAAPELVVGAALDLPPGMQAQLAFIDVDIAKHAGTTAPLFRGAFAIDLKDEANAPSCHEACTAQPGPRLTLDELRASSLGDLVDPRLTAGVLADWDVKATADSALPGIGARFRLAWDWDSDDPGNADRLSIGFEDVAIDPGQFLDSNIGPVIQQVISVFKPVQPVLDTIVAPLPVLSDLSKLAGGDDVTLGTLAEAYSTLAGGPDIEPFLEVVKTIKSLSGLVGECPTAGATFCLNLGDFAIKKETALTTANSAATARSFLGEATPSAESALKQLSDTVGGKLISAAGPTQADGAGACPNNKRGISFPALEDPTALFGLLLNQDVELACFDSGPLSLGFEMNLRLGPVYAPPPVYIVISGGASVSLRIAAGFDTYGIRTAVESGKLTADVLDSLYFKTTDTTGAPLPVVQFKGFLAAGASVSAVIIEVGVKGGIELTVNFTWNDPNNDGKFRFNEFLATAVNNPICLFNVGGQLDLFITVFITLGIDPFSVSFDFELVRVKLLDFSLKPDCTPPPPRLGGTKDGTLYLFAGKHGGDTERGEPWGNDGTADEGWVVRQVADDPSTGADERAVVVQALGITESFPDVGGGAIDEVVLDGRGYDGSLKVVFNGGTKDQPFDKRTIVLTGDGDDAVRAGSGASFIDGGKGVDNITTTDRPDLAQSLDGSAAATVAGGPGKDGITVGNAADVVHGDSALAVTQADVEGVVPLTGDPVTLDDVVVSAAPPADPGTEGDEDGPDTISAGLGGTVVWGGGGADTIGTASDSPLAATLTPRANYVAQTNTIVGGSGGDRIRSGSAADQIWTGSKTEPGKDGTGAGDADGDVNTVDTGSGSDTVFGSNASDNVATASTATQTATVYGAGGRDILSGGDGTDKLFGGPADDYVIAEPSTVLPPTTPDVLGDALTVTRLPRQSSDSAKVLAGGGGRDRLYGGNGNALVYGDRDDFTCGKGSDPLSDAPVEGPTVTGDPAVDDAPDLVLGGAGVDTINAGGGNDHVYARGADDLVCGNADDDRLDAGSGADHVYGGSGNDTALGGGDADHVFGNAGTDTLYGGQGPDVLEGNAGTDTAFGGTEDDVVVGGTRKAGRADARDVLYGDAGADTLIGDNGVPGTLHDLGSGNASLGGKDLLLGGSEDDAGYGGLDADEVYGGSGDDQLEGNSASDQVFGEEGSDNVIGGSSQLGAGGASFPDAGDQLHGGPGGDVIAGDNAALTRTPEGTRVTKGRELAQERTVLLHDLGYGPAVTSSGVDQVFGGAGNDVLLGQGAGDLVRGDGGDDYAEGGQGSDSVFGDDGQDDLVGGGHAVHAGAGVTRSGQLDEGDTVDGGPGADVAVGDNGQVLRDPATPTSEVTKGRGATERTVELFDLEGAAGVPPAPLTAAGRDHLLGRDAEDVLLGQGDDDRLQGGAADDHAEGGPGRDWLEGGDGDDDQVGGSSTVSGADTGDTTAGQPDADDTVLGGAGNDLQLGDNAVVGRVAPTHPLTVRLATPGQLVDPRRLRLLDLRRPGAGDELATPDASRFGGDRLSGGQGVDVQLGQDGDEQVFGGSEEDYQEGNGGRDTLRGDQVLSAFLPLAGVDTGYRGSRGTDLELEGVQGAAGQDDQLGGSSRKKHRDVGDLLHGDGAADFQLGDNGELLRTVLPGNADYARYTAYNPVTVVRQANRFDVGFGTAVPRPYGDDSFEGDDGDDYQWGQDGDDVMHGDADNDDMHGELGADSMFGDAGEDAMIGDRGLITDTKVVGTGRRVAVDTQGPAFFAYEGLRDGQLDRRVDLLQDGDGDVDGDGKPVEAPGLSVGGNDTMRGGTGHDSMHGAFGDDLMNGDSGGDWLFGAEGVDVMWGGKGNDVPPSDPQADARTEPGSPYFDSYVDYLFGGASGKEDLSNRYGVTAGADVLDWRPRGTYAACQAVTKVSTACDPGDWFRATDTHDADAGNNQHNGGRDWIYGGEGRDVMQANIGNNGPDTGDRLVDWVGAFNLYTHCNASYGDDGDIRQQAPALETLLHTLAYGSGVGSSLQDVYAKGTSAERELAFVQNGEKGNNGSAFPTTPGHFTTPACTP